MKRALAWITQILALAIGAGFVVFVFVYGTTTIHMWVDPKPTNDAFLNGLVIGIGVALLVLIVLPVISGVRYVKRAVHRLVKTDEDMNMPERTVMVALGVSFLSVVLALASIVVAASKGIGRG